MGFSSVSLPPLVDGAAKGTLTLQLGRVEWESPAEQLNTVAVVRWWGDDGPGDELDASPAVVSTKLQFQLRSGPKYIAQYLADMGSLALVFKRPAAGRRASSTRDSSSTAIVGTASVGLRHLGVGAPVQGTFAILGDRGAVIGRALVSLSLAFTSPAVSSFELNEHMAATAAAAEEEAGAAAAAEAPGASATVTVAASAEPGGGLRCPDTLRQLEEVLAREGTCAAELEKLGLGEVLSGADLERLVRQLLPGLSEASISYAAAAINLVAASYGLTEPGSPVLDTLSRAVKESACHERTLVESPGWVARKLKGLVMELSGRHLDLAKAFSQADENRDEQISYQQLVTMLRSLCPGVSDQELLCVLAAVAGEAEAGAGAVTLPVVKRTLQAFTFEQAYPTEEEARLQEQAAAAAAARKGKAEAAAPASHGQPGPPAGSQRQRLAKLRSSSGGRRQGAVGLPAPAEGPRAAGEPSAPPQIHSPAVGWPAARPEALANGVVAIGVPLPAGTAAAPVQLSASGVPGACVAMTIEPALGLPATSGAAAPATAPAALAAPARLAQPQLPQQHQQQTVVVGIPVQQPWAAQPTQLAAALPLQQPWAAVQAANVQLAAAMDPVQALIDKAEHLKLAMNRAALSPVHGTASTAAVAASSSIAGRPFSYAAGLQPSSLHGPLVPAGAAAGALALPTLGNAAAATGVGAGLSATSAALIEAAKALTAPQPPSESTAGSLAAAAPGLSTTQGPVGALTGGGAAAEPGQLPGTGDGSAARELPLVSVGAIGSAPGAVVGSAPSAVAPELSWDDDPSELAEDIILQELFFGRDPAQPSSADSGVGGLATGSGGREPAAQQKPAAQQQQQQQQQGVASAQPAPPDLILTLHLAGLRLLPAHGTASKVLTAAAAAAAEGPQPLEARMASVRGVVKPLYPSAQPVHFSLVPSSVDGAALRPAASPAPLAPWFEGQHATSAQLEVTVPQACMQQGRLPPTLFIEVWDQASKLIGIVRVPLSFCHLPAAPAGQQGPGPGSALPAVVCEGRWDVWNVLEGRAEGSMEVVGVVQEKGQPQVVPAMRHGFSVTIQTAYRLPGSVAYAEAELHGPDSRYIKYMFPGQPEPLFTKEVPVMSNPTFDATAHHSIMLPPEQDVAEMLASGVGSSRRLRFEVWDQWVDGRQELFAWAELPMTELSVLVRSGRGDSEAEAVAAAPAGTTVDSVAPVASATHLLPLLTEYDVAGAGPGAAASAKGPALRIDLSYYTARVLVPAPVPATGGRPAGAAETHGHSSGQNDSTGEMAVEQQWREQQQKQQQLLQQQEQVAAARFSGHARPVAHNKSSRQPQGAAAAGAAAEEGHGGADLDEGAENDVLLANACYARPLLAAGVPSSKGVEAVLCVEIIRACGLAAAVKEACAFSSSSTALSRARQVGAHPFARLALFPSDSVLQKRARPLQTPFQAQTFCPEFHARHEYRLRLDARMLQALAEQELLVELWHHLPRAQAVAAALSAGRSSVAAGAAGQDGGGSAGGEREVFLGSASGPLLDVLRKPQGFHGWLGLKSRRGEPVGAVQLAVCLAEIQGQPVFGAAPDRSLLHHSDALQDILPSQLIWLLGDAGERAFRGQQAAATVALEELVPPQEEPSSGRDADRPKADLYFAAYRLPGAPCSVATAARTLTAGLGKAPAAAAAIGGRTWSAKLGHLGTFQVKAGPALSKALASCPLTIDVYKQPAPQGSGRLGRGVEAQLVHVGTAEVDLCGLLWPRQPADLSPRTVSGSFLVIDPTARSLGNARVQVRVTLHLSPGASVLAQPSKGGGAGAADVVQGAWELVEEGEEVEEVEGGEHCDEVMMTKEQELGGMGKGGRPWQQPAAPAGVSAAHIEAAAADVAGSAQLDTLKAAAAAVPLPPAAAGLPAAPGLASISQPPLPCSPPPQPQASALTAAASRPGGRSSMVQHGDRGTGSSEGGGGSQPGPSAASGAASNPSPAGAPLQASGGAGELPGSASEPEPPSSSQQVASSSPTPNTPDNTPCGKLLIHIEAATRLHLMQPGTAADLRQSAAGGGSSGSGNIGSSSSSSSSSRSGGGGRRSSGDGRYSVYVCLTWGPCKAKLCTAAVGVQGTPGSSGGSARWDEVLEVDADAATFGATAVGGSAARSQLPLAGATGGLGSTGSGSRAGAGGSPILLLNVWSCPAGTAGAPAAATDTAGGGRAASPLPASSGHALVGCAAVDLTTLPLLGEVRGFWNVVDYMQQVKGVLQLAVRPNEELRQQLLAARPRSLPMAAVAAAAARSVGGPPLDHGGPEPAAAAAAGRDAMSGGGFASPAGEAPGGEAPQGRAEPGSPQFDDEGRESANLGEMQARMEALQVLSQRLRGSTGTAGMAAAPPPAAPSGSHSSGRSRSPASAGESRAAGAAGQLEQQLELEEQRPSPDPASMRIRELEASDEEEVGGWFSTGRATGRSAPFVSAWSGSDSDDDAMALVGIAVEGAVSPGAVSEEEEEPERDASRPVGSLLMADDWMFDISKPPPRRQAAAELAAPQQEQQEQQQQGGSREGEGSSSGGRRPVAFRNSLVPAVVAEPGRDWPRQAAQQAQQEGEQAQAQEQAGGAASAGSRSQAQAHEQAGGAASAGSSSQATDAVAAAVAAAERPSNMRPLPAMPQLPAGPTRSPSEGREGFGGADRPAPPGRGLLLGGGVGVASSRAQNDDWMFDIRRKPAAGPGRGTSS